MQEVYDACVKANEKADEKANWLTCIDYLLASTEYESFMELAYDHYCMGAYEPGEDEEWDAEPAGEEDEVEPVPLDQGEEEEQQENGL